MSSVKATFGSLALKLGSWRVLDSSGVFGSQCVSGLDVCPFLTWTTVADLLLSFRSLVFPLQLLGSPVLYRLSVDPSMGCNFINNVA